MNYPPNHDHTTHPSNPYPTTGQTPPAPGYAGYPPSQPGYPQMPPQQQPMQPPPKKKSKAGLIIGIIVGAVVLCGVIGAIANSGNTGTKVSTTTTGNNNTTNTGQTNAQQPPANQHFKVGETVKVGDKWEITVNSVTTSQGSEYFAPEAGNTYVLINVSMKNISNEEQNTSSLLEWKLKGKDGVAYKDAIFSDPNEPAPNGKVEAGGPAKGSLSYEVPVGVKEVTLSFSPELFQSGQTIWDLSIP